MKTTYVTTGAKPIKRVEGDIWEERGKTWTIKNGVKRTVSKMDHARKQFATPFTCPNCGSTMKHHLDEKMWTIHKLCFNCVIDMEHEVMKAGKWEEYEKGKIVANANGYLKDLQDYLQDYLKESVAQAHVTEDGLIEGWSDASQTHLKQVSDTVIQDITKKVEDYKNV